MIAIGASTGGVEALREILAELPVEMPPILIAQHMPAGYTETFARRLNTICRHRGEAGARTASPRSMVSPTSRPAAGI